MFSEAKLTAASKNVRFVDFSMVGGSRVLSVGYLTGWDLFQVESFTDIRHIMAKAEASAVVSLRPFLLKSYLHVAICIEEFPTAVKIELTPGSTVYTLRASRPIVNIFTSEEYLGLASEDQLQLYSISPEFTQIFSMQTGGSVIAIGPRWVAFPLPPQQSLSQPPSLSVWDQAQRVFDNLLLGSNEEMPTPPNELRPGIVGVREAAGGGAVGSFEAHAEPLEFLRWDISGIFLLSASGRGHQVLIHKAIGGARGKSEFALSWTLSRGVTPATISDAVFLGGRAVVASSRGTVHFFSPGSDTADARVRFGAALGSEELMPLVLLEAGGEAMVATRAGLIEVFTVENGNGICKGKSACNFVRGASGVFPTSGEFTLKTNNTGVLRTSGDYVTGEGDEPKAWYSPQLDIYKGSFAGDVATGSMIECATKTRLDPQRGRSYEGVKVKLTNKSMIESSLAMRLPKHADEATCAPGSESPDGFIAI